MTTSSQIYACHHGNACLKRLDAVSAQLSHVATDAIGNIHRNGDTLNDLLVARGFQVPNFEHHSLPKLKCHGYTYDIYSALLRIYDMSIRLSP